MDRPKIIRIATVSIFLNIVYRDQFRFLKDFFSIVLVASFDPKHSKELVHREGVRFVKIPFKRTFSLYHDIRSLWLLFLLIKREKPEIVHTHTPKAGLIGMFSAYLARVPIRIHTYEGSPMVTATGLVKSVLKFSEWLTCSLATNVYSNSNGLREILIRERVCQPNHISVVGNCSSNGINVEYFKPNYSVNQQFEIDEVYKSLGISKDDFVFLFVGRIARDKGIMELVSAFKFLRSQSNKSVKLLMIGPYEKEYGALGDELIREIDTNEDILTPGRFDDVRPYYVLSDCYVFPSYREGFPNSLMEAGAMSLPIIASDINGCNEIVIDGENGILIPPKDTIALLEAMKKIIDDEHLRERLTDNARRLIENRFKRELICNQLLNEYLIQLKKNIFKNEKRVR